MTLTLSVLPGRFAVSRMEPLSPVQPPEGEAAFWSVTRTAEETSVVSREEDAPAGARVESGWRMLKVEGPLDFALTGILASIVSPLAAAGIPLFAISTFDTDYLLFRDHDLSGAIAALRQAGHRLAG